MADTTALISTPFEAEYSRDEYFLICFDNVLCNSNYLICKYLLDNLDVYEKEYPLLRIFFDKTDDKIFIFSFNLSKTDLLPFLSGGDTNSNRDFIEERNIIESYIDYKKYTNMMFNIALSLFMLGEQKKIRKIYIYSDNMTDFKIDYITRCFGVDVCDNKVFTIQSTCKDILSQEELGKEITTIFVHDTNSIYTDVLANTSIDKKEKSFYIMESQVNIDAKTDTLNNGDSIRKLMHQYEFEVKLYAPSYNTFYEGIN